MYQAYIKAFVNTASPFHSNIHSHWLQDRPIPSQRKYASMWRPNKNWLHTFYMFYLILTAHANHCNTKGKITIQTRPERDLSDLLSQLPVQLSNCSKWHNRCKRFLQHRARQPLILVSTIKSKNPVLGRKTDLSLQDYFDLSSSYPTDSAGIYQGSLGCSLLIMSLFLFLLSLLFGIFLLRLNLLLSTSHIYKQKEDI